MTNAPILVIESDRDLGAAIVEQLLADGYHAELARTAEHARVLASVGSPRLAVLGSLDPSREALQLLEEIRGSGQPWNRALPAIVIGLRARQLDVLRAFDVGADDFLPWPARYLELRARIRAILRRSERDVAQASIEVGPLQIDTRTRTVNHHGQLVGLRRLEFDLLLQMAGDPQRVFTKQELLRAVWGYGVGGSTRTLDSHASRLRRKLHTLDGQRWVINVWGIGYRLT